MTLQHLLTCDTQTLASHVTVEHDTFMTLKHLHDTQTLEHTSRNFMYSISTCVTFKHFHYKTCKHAIGAILQHSTWYQYQVFKFTSRLLRWRRSSCPPQFRRLSLSALASPSDWYHPSYVGALCSAVPNLKWREQFLLIALKRVLQFSHQVLGIRFLCWVPI